MKYTLFMFGICASSFLYGMSSSIKEIQRTALKSAIDTAIHDGKNLNQTDPDGDTYLVACTRNGFTDLVEFLLKNGADPNTQTDSQLGNATPLMYAVARCNLPCIQLLLEYKADPNIQDKEGRTALMDVATSFERELFSDKSRLAGRHPFKERKNILKILMLYGGNLNIKTHDNKTARDFAVRYGFTKLTSLIDHYQQESTAAFHAVKAPITPATLSILRNIKFSFPLAMRDAQGNTLLHHAMQREDPSAAGYLLSQNIDLLDEPNNAGLTPIQCMISKGESIPGMYQALANLVGKPLEMKKD